MRSPKLPLFLSMVTSFSSRYLVSYLLLIYLPMWAWWHIPVAPALGGLRLDACEFSLGYIVEILSQNKTTQNLSCLFVSKPCQLLLSIMTAALFL